MTTRDEFEKWAIKEGYAVEHFIADQYPYLSTQAAWNAWQARQHEISALKAEIERLHSRDAAPDLLEALVSIAEYWNQDTNETAMEDACWHAVNTALTAIAKADDNTDHQFRDATKLVIKQKQP